MTPLTHAYESKTKSSTSTVSEIPPNQDVEKKPNFNGLSPEDVALYQQGELSNGQLLLADWLELLLALEQAISFMKSMEVRAGFSQSPKWPP
ncbi:hypothetical protein GW915_04220 [bacterium]|nr:hypothetical protein [bacterium]